MMNKWRVRSKFLVYLVSIGAFFGPFTQTIYSPMLPEMAAMLSTSQDAINLTIAVYPLFFAFMQLVYGPLLDRYGRRRVLLTGFLFYLLATLGTALSQTVEMLLVYRSLQSIGVAVGSVAAITIIGDLYEGTMRGRSMGIYQMMVALGPGLGPVFGGFIGDYYGARSIFWALLGISAALWLTIAAVLPETRTDTNSPQRFQLKQLTVVLKHRVGLGIVALASVQYAIFYTLLILLPLIAVDRYQLGPDVTGLMFLPITAGIVIGSLSGGRMMELFDLKKLLMATAVCNALAILLIALLATISIAALIAGISCFGLSLGLSLPAQTTLLANELSRYRATSTGIYNFFRYVWMTIGPIAGTYGYRFGFEMVFYVSFGIAAITLVFVYRRLFVRDARVLYGSESM